MGPGRREQGAGSREQGAGSRIAKVSPARAGDIPCTSPLVTQTPGQTSDLIAQRRTHGTSGMFSLTHCAASGPGSAIATSCARGVRYRICRVSASSYPCTPWLSAKASCRVHHDHPRKIAAELAARTLVPTLLTWC